MTSSLVDWSVPPAGRCKNCPRAHKWCAHRTADAMARLDLLPANSTIKVPVELHLKPQVLVDCRTTINEFGDHEITLIRPGTIPTSYPVGSVGGHASRAAVRDLVIPKLLELAWKEGLCFTCGQQLHRDDFAVMHSRRLIVISYLECWADPNHLCPEHTTADLIPDPF